MLPATLLHEQVSVHQKIIPEGLLSGLHFILWLLIIKLVDRTKLFQKWFRVSIVKNICNNPRILTFIIITHIMQLMR